MTKNIKKKLKYDRNKAFYRGGFIRNKPHGYGILIIYDDNKYAKSLLPEQIRKIYLGNWKNGKFSGKGRLVSYAGLEYESDKFGMPTPLEEYKSNFKNGEPSSRIKPNLQNPGEIKFSEIIELLGEGGYKIMNPEDLKNALKDNARLVDRKKFKYNGNINSNINLSLLETIIRSF